MFNWLSRTVYSAGDQCMKTFQADDGHIFVHIEPGEMALESIREVCDQYDVDSGVVVSGIATFRNLNYHYVPTDEFPKEKSERNEFFELDGAWEVGTIDGAIADGEPHLHVVAYNGDQTIAGHLEEGNEVHINCEIVIRPVEGLELTRKKNDMNVSVLSER